MQRPVVPFACRRNVFDSLHGLSHPGILATQKLVEARLMWPGINADVRQWTRACLQCQRVKIKRHCTAAITTLPTHYAHFGIVHVDLVCPLSPSQGFTYLLMCVDRFNRWPEAIPLTSISAESVAKAILLGWIGHYGVPSCILTDHGRQFKSQLWKTSLHFWDPEKHIQQLIFPRVIAWSSTFTGNSRLH